MFKKKEIFRDLKQKIICCCSTVILLSNQLSPLVFADSNNLFNEIDNNDIKTLKQYFTNNKIESFIPMNVLSNNFLLSKYELLILSEAIKEDINKQIKNENERIDILTNLLNLQNKYKEDYTLLFNKQPDEIKIGNDNINSEKDFQLPQLNNIYPNQQPDSSTPSINNFEASNSIPENNTTPTIDDIQNSINNSKSPDELASNMSMINISTVPKNNNNDDNINKNDSENPLNDFFNTELAPNNIQSKNASNIDETLNYSNDTDLLSDIINTTSENSINKGKHFFISLSHDIYYVDEGGSGNIPLDTNVTNDNGDYYQSSVTNQYQLEDALEIGFGVRVHKALDLMIGLVASNDNGSIFSQGTKWEFGNVLFKFHPERLTVKEMSQLKDQGIIVKDNGKYVGKQIGHEVIVGTDTTSGDVSAQLGNNPNMAMSYNKDDGLRLGNNEGKYFIGYGKLSLDLSSYTLQLSDCKAVEVGYNDKNESLILLYGKPKDATEGTTSESSSNEVSKTKGIYDRTLFAAQYTSKKMFPFMDIAFNYATAKDHGSLKTANGSKQEKSTVFSIAINSKNMPNTSFEGEFAHSLNDYDLNNNSSQNASSGNADYLDITHRFSNKLSSTLHLVNIDGTYDASSLVEDKTGDYLLTTNTGDGIPDYLYKSGQRGLDFILNYTLNDSAAMSFGYTRYSKTTEINEKTGLANSKTGIFLSGNKRWDLSTDDGISRGTINLQQRFEYRDVSNKDYINHTSDTTLSYQGSPWTDGEVSMDAQHIDDNVDGNENRFDLSVAHNFYPLERVTITPKIEYQKKSGSEGIENNSPMDSSVLINSLTIGYELIPDELTVNLLISKEKYNIISSEIDESTGKKVDGEKRDILGTGIGLVWEPTQIKGLNIGISYRKDKVHYYTPTDDNSNQDVWELSANYDKPISDNVRASISYDYKSAKDKIKPIYDDITRTISININSSINDTTSINIEHSYESEYKPLDKAANHKEHTTVIRMTNKF